MDILFVIGGLAVLIFGGEFLVKGAVGLALKAQISTLVIGTTVVSFGTSAPELLVSVNAALAGGENAYMSIGNVIGSNIANIGLVLGVTALIFPIAVHRDSIKIDWPVMLGATLLFIVFMLNLKVERWEGIVLTTLIVLFTLFLIRRSKRAGTAIEEEIEENDSRPIWKNIVFLVLGILGLVFGAKWMLAGAVGIAEFYEVPPFIIGVTILAFGTSVPELATSAIAAYRKQSDIAVGNVIGSNIFNILSVVGITSMVTDMKLKEEVLDFDSLWMLAFVLLLYPLMAINKKITRISGALLVIAYLSYITILILRGG